MEQWIELLKANNYLGIKQYLKNGANPNDEEENGESVICFAMRYHCDEEIIELLADSGADLFHTDHEGVSVFDVAVTYNNLPLIERLIREGFDVNRPTRNSGFTPLMGAVCYGRTEIIRKLLEMGVDVSARDRHGLSALDFARKMHKKSILALLEGGTNGTD
ncbi:ankyrin repeat domain-containing protein [Sulfuricurvum sp. IAE1]|jgi:ankyrin repeat protein|uniref:ankyrin repeat domain-containing protein n=1 Tax=Sulfuricurvum sp. IAE1 TaxID=2546102 RepID=UPI001051D5E3|nr:ankyrin repeat domain-containing protein [Sulfuricurvum sp. IAE1]MDD3769981.1 ankyrin repeat domain-containing protein [Sulfuricurvum sp.]MDX9966906.1 ankyrin repeat domain-containing protein [Sulfuricurvum sp.]TDA63134.1 ankyrin repeat domain-containing protein [Sulfuricurvum sp. IAE1]